MPLVDEVKAVCRRLAPLGWGALLRDKQGLDIEADDLKTELTRVLDGIDRGVPGFEDFAREGNKGIEAGQPARSLLYHALCSPNVLLGADRHRLRGFPTAREIEVVEDYVFGIAPPTLAELTTRVGGAPLALAVFALEYRLGSQTCHRMHADLVFSRTGIARVGTTAPFYDAARRGFVPISDDDAFAVRVSPARYAPFLAVQLPGNRSGFLPMRFQNRPDPDKLSDDRRKFWVPVHKIFPGDECLAGLGVGPALDVHLAPHLVNEKLRRFHMVLATFPGPGGGPFDTGVSPGLLDQPPFVFSDGLAGLSSDPDHAKGTLVPVPHATLVAPATLDGRPLAFNVPPKPPLFATSLEFDRPGGGLNGPEYANIRREILEDGTQIDLNTRDDLRDRVAAGGYRALHYLDFTADGWIEAASDRLKALPSVPAFAVVGPTDFFPGCDQRELTEWTADLPADFRDGIFETPPDALSDQRFMPNLVLPGGPFAKAQGDTTATAIVSLFGPVSTMRTESPPGNVLRHSHIPDDSAGVFAPGWDLSTDTLPDGTAYLTSYGLGSPFPEDAKLCAALSTFWPAAAPDATRTFEYGPLVQNRYFTVSPLTDEEIGQVGHLPWDGIPGPAVVEEGGRQFAEYTSIDYADYVTSALEGKFSLRVTAHIVERDYQDRVFAMALAYKALGVQVKKDKLNWIVLSFRAVQPGDPESQMAQQQARLSLPGDAYRFEVFHNPRKASPSPTLDFRKVRLAITDRRKLFVDPANHRVLMFKGGGPWQGRQFATP